MSRTKNFARNLLTSYLQMGVNMAYSFVSVPIILYWLPKAEFGLWCLLLQVMGYIGMVDMGINQAIARYLVDYKDHKADGKYGSLLKTSALVSVLQGLFVLAIINLGSPLFTSLLKIPPEYTQVFIRLMRIQGVIAAFTFCMNPLAIMLNAHQRMDLISRQGMTTLIAALVLMILFLIKGFGIYSFVYSGVITSLFAPCQLFWHCRRLGMLPKRGEWGRISWPQFKEVFIFGKDVFLMSVGTQLTGNSQVIIITRTLGLDAAAAWSVGTKIFTFMARLQFQPYSAATAGLCEMVARNETERLRKRFSNLVVFCASFGAFLGVAFASCNSLFIQIWTSGKIGWSPLNDVLLAIWLFITAMQMTHCNFVAVTKQIGWMRFIYFAEGLSFVALALAIGYHWDISGIIVCSLVCLFLFPYLFGLLRSSRYFRSDVPEIAFGWLKPTFKLTAALIPTALGLWIATRGLPPLARLVIHAAGIAMIGGVLFLRLGLPLEMIKEIQGRLPKPAGRLIGLLFPSLA